MGVIKNKIFTLHGWAYSTEKWNPFVDLLKQKANVELLKIPGLTSPIDKPWDINDYVLWLKKIADKEKDKIILIGHSSGGRISLWFSQKYPEKVKKLILIDSMGIYHNEFPIRFKRVIFKAIAKVGRKITSSRLLETLLYKAAREKDYKESSPLTKQTLRNLFQSDQILNILKTRIPTLIIWGRKDSITPLSDGQTMHERIKDSKLKIIENAHHSPMFTHPNETIKIILNYLTM